MDNRSDRGHADRRQVAGKQDYEVDYLAAQLQREFPRKTRKEIEQAILACTSNPKLNNDRAKVTDCARRRLGS